MKPTVKDVARLAGVSSSSVSRYLNNTAKISPLAAFKIKKAIQELNYIPNPIARSLKSGQSNIIGVILPSLNSYFSQLCNGISDFFYDYGYLVFFCESGENGEKEEFYINQMEQLKFAGIFLAAISSSPDRINELSKTTHTILFDRVKDAEVTMFLEDNYQLSKNLTEYAIKKGHKNILSLFGSSKSQHAIDRNAGTLSLMKKYDDIKITPIMDCYDREVTYSTIKKFFSKKEPPTAILAYGVKVTENVIATFNSLNINLFDIYFSCWALNNFEQQYGYNIPRIEENPYEMGLISSNELLNNINAGKKPSKKNILYLPTNFVTNTN